MFCEVLQHAHFTKIEADRDEKKYFFMKTNLRSLNRKTR